MKVEDYKKSGIARKMIASVVFDLEKSQTTFNVPTVNWYYNFNDLDNPITVNVCLGWSNTAIHLPFNEEMQSVLQGNLSEKSIFYLKELEPNYKGLCEVNGYYESAFKNDLTKL